MSAKLFPWRSTFQCTRSKIRDQVLTAGID